MLRFTEQRSITLLIISALFLPFLCFSNIGAEWNPTGNPIGGGPGYSDSIRHQGADYVVTNKSELLSALGTALSGQIIYVADNAEIDMSGESDVYIPGGVTLASGRGRTIDDTISWGGMIYTDAYGGYSLFRLSGENVRVTGLRFRGEFRNYREGVAPATFDPGGGLKFFNVREDSFEFDNCEMWGVGNLGVGDYDVSITCLYVHHCYFHSTMMCVQGVPCYNDEATGIVFEANLYDYIRQNIAASGRPSASYEARYNICLEHCATHSFDRHGYPSTGDTAGYLTTIHHNTTFPNGRVVHIRGRPVDSALVFNNWFRNSTQEDAVEFNVPENCAKRDNHYGNSTPDSLLGTLPTAAGRVSTDSGAYPLTVTFEDNGSNDPNGSIAWYEWDFGDNSPTVRKSTAEHTYNKVGVYLAELTVHDSDGCVAFDTMHIEVTPTTIDSYYISFWVNDRYVESDTGYFKKQVFLDDWKIWESDMAGYNGWEHITVNITDSINVWNPESVTITLRLCCTENMSPDATIYETWWDDIAFFWGGLKNGDFEEGAAHWTYSENEDWFWGGRTSSDARSGTNSYYIKFQKDMECEAGEWGQISQKIGIQSSGIAEHHPETVNLDYPSPNPSMHGSTICYQLHAKSEVSMAIYDVSGRFIKQLIDRRQEPGDYQIYWNSRDERNRDVASGVYFYRLVVYPVYGEDRACAATRELIILR
jgi:PKD repeat protein